MLLVLRIQELAFENAEQVSVDKWRHPVLVMTSVLAAAHRNLQYITKHYTEVR